MKILVGKTFGIGNAVLSIPMVKALCTLGEVHVLVGNTPDDYGAAAVFAELSNRLNIKVLQNPPGTSEKFDVAVMSIPFDGRWRNGIDYVADRVLDERKRPDNIERLGFDMWKKHEALYQMDNAIELGYSGPIPDSSFLNQTQVDDNFVYLGIGFKRDIGGFGLSKHFGNDRFAELIKKIHAIRPSVKFVSTGNELDLLQVASPIMKKVPHDSYRYYPGSGLKHAFSVVCKCGSYIGNDTGMMHVAASTGIPTFGLFLSHDLITKNHPFNDRWVGSLLDQDIEVIAHEFAERVWGRS